MREPYNSFSDPDTGWPSWVPGEGPRPGHERRCSGCDRSIGRARTVCAECGTQQGYQLAAQDAPKGIDQSPKCRCADCLR